MNKGDHTKRDARAHAQLETSDTAYTFPLSRPLPLLAPLPMPLSPTHSTTHSSTSPTSPSLAQPNNAHLQRPHATDPHLERPLDALDALEIDALPPAAARRLAPEQ